jgi:hypothetical protein
MTAGQLLALLRAGRASVTISHDVLYVHRFEVTPENDEAPALRIALTEDDDVIFADIENDTERRELSDAERRAAIELLRGLGRDYS